MFEPITRARPHTGHFENSRDVVLVVNAIEFGFEMRRNVHLHDVDMGHAILPIAGLVIARLGESAGDDDRVCSGPAATSGARDGKAEVWCSGSGLRVAHRLRRGGAAFGGPAG